MRRVVTTINQIDPAPDFIFRRLLLNDQSNGASGTVGRIKAVTKAKYTSSKSEHVEFSLPDPPALSVELGMYVFALISPGQPESCSVALSAEVSASTEMMVQDLLKATKLFRYESDLVVISPLVVTESMAQTDLKIIAPAACKTDVQGCFSNLEILDMSGRITVHLSFGAVRLLQTTGTVDVRTGPEGGIVFAGEEGNVRLKSGGNIDIKITGEVFRGHLEALTHEEPIRVLLPLGFRSSFEATAPNVICRADIGSRAQRSKQNGKTVLTFGSTEPVLKFVSVQGSIVIDNAVND